MKSSASDRARPLASVSRLPARALAMALVLIAAVAMPSSSRAQVFLGANVDDILLDHGQTFTVHISASQLDSIPQALYGAGFKLRYDPTRLDFLGVQFSPGIMAPGMLRFERAQPESGAVALSFTRTFGEGFTNTLDICDVQFVVRGSAPFGLTSASFQNPVAVNRAGASILGGFGGAGFLVTGTTTSVGPDIGRAGISLGPVTPNPAASQAQVLLVLPNDALVGVRILDVGGREVRRASIDELLPAGRHSIPLDCTGLPPGGYTLVCRVNGRLVSRAFVHL